MALLRSYIVILENRMLQFLDVAISYIALLGLLQLLVAS